MNYRHIYHAGNFADIFKHLILMMALGYLQNKEKGLFALDAFAGIGLYDLTSIEAQKTNEYIQGVQAFMDTEFSNPDLSNFQNILRPFWQQKSYPGSPLLIAEALRPQDRLYANELHPLDVVTLKDNLRGLKNTQILNIDAYESIRANVPPPERRGLVLVDPPFEKKDEFEIIGRQLQEWIKRWPTGCYMIWYPVKAGAALHNMFDAAQDLDVKNIFVTEILLHPRNKPDSFNGCGVMIINTPYQIPERIESLSGPLNQALKGHSITAEWLKQD